MTADKPRLGEKTEYPEAYSPALLVSIPRAEGRNQLALHRPMHGMDVWTGYELSWLTPSGKPKVAIAEFSVDCQSPCIVESKSFKLYLNSLNQHVVSDEAVLREMLATDLGEGFGALVDVSLFSLDAFAARGIQTLAGKCLDELEIDCGDRPSDQPDRLALTTAADSVEESLYSHLLKTNCPVTGQPDWASVQIRYRGQQIDREGLLRYLVSYRQHQDFHENCVESIFCDILSRCQPESLTVYARYTRRGGLDINPWRSTEPSAPEFCRLSRQ